ncbi:MAG TPA: type III polyketide synthase [Terracidiphilus sp.]|jgi:predicted naringenin-chalcone synthase
MTTAHIHRIATAVPAHDVHRPFITFAESMLPEGTTRNLFKRMVRMSAIDHRYSFLQPIGDGERYWRDSEDLYVVGDFPTTKRRMQAFEKFAPRLAGCALDKLRLSPAERQAITHVIVTCCTGLYAPGLDIDIVNHLSLNPSVERTMIGFMGCYAAINALKSARHVVRSEPGAKVLILNLELCSLHLKETADLEQMLSFLLFADGCAACVVSGEPEGLAIDSFLAINVPETSDLITWRIGEMGFDMQLSGKVPGEIKRSLPDARHQMLRGRDAAAIDLWAVHPGGRTILDAVEQGLELPANALAWSRDILARFGNMSSATVMFVLEQILKHAQKGQSGCAMSFGPGITAETMLFHAA